jgi:hypothetical protein
MSINNYRTVDQKNNTLIARQEPPPDVAPRIFLRPNKYDPDRANLAIFNAGKAKEVAVDLSPLLRSGDRFRVINVLDFFGSPVIEATYQGRPVSIPIPVQEATGNGEFCAFAVFREPLRSSTARSIGAACERSVSDSRPSQPWSFASLTRRNTPMAGPRYQTPH